MIVTSVERGRNDCDQTCWLAADEFEDDVWEVKDEVWGVEGGLAPGGKKLLTRLVSHLFSRLDCAVPALV